jgi:hypothetical protein
VICRKSATLSARQAHQFVYCQYLHCFLHRFDRAKRGLLTEALRPKWRMHRPRPEREQECPVLAAMQLMNGARWQEERDGFGVVTIEVTSEKI